MGRGRGGGWCWSRTGKGSSGGRKKGVVCGVGQELLGGPSYFFISLVLGPLNSLVWYVHSSRYIWSLAPIFCFYKNNKRHHHSWIVCGIVAAPVHAPSHAPLLLPLLLSHNIPLPRIPNVGILLDVIGGVESLLWEGCYPTLTLGQTCGSNQAS